MKLLSFLIAGWAVLSCRGFSPRSCSFSSLRRLSSSSFDVADSYSSSPILPSQQCPLAQYNTTIQLPSYPLLMAMQTGESFTSDTISVATENGASYDFCVKFYPRGGGHASAHSALPSQKPKSGFGMSYRVLPMFGPPPDEKVGVYLQFLPNHKKETVDATFALRMKGHQRKGPKFDVEWRAGMRFVHLDDTKLAEGRANDFGAHLMQTHLLADFVGYNDIDSKAVDSAVDLSVDIIIHEKPSLSDESQVTVDQRKDQRTTSFFGRALRDLRDSQDSSDYHDPEQLRVGRIVVPVLRNLSERPAMFRQGTYPGVEYRILRVLDRETGEDIFYSRPGADYELKPIYPLVQQLERQWPVQVNEKDIPKLYTPAMYNGISAIGSLFTAVTGLLSAFIVSQAISIFVIPSRSMEPTLQVGDVLLVDKLTPRLTNKLNLNKYNEWVGRVILFHPTESLQDIVLKSGGRKLTDRELFVKRVAAGPGSTLKVVDTLGAVEIDGRKPVERRDFCGEEPTRLIEKFLRQGDEFEVCPNQVAVLGDCSSVSIDSRVWGPLPTENIVGRPLLRVWPLSRVGRVDSLVTDWNE